MEEFKYYTETNDRVHGHRIIEVSNYGRIRVNGEIVTPILKNGYPLIAQTYVHRIVAELFIPNPDNKPCIDHIDGDRTNNMYTNLRWVTYKENSHNVITYNRQKASLTGVAKSELHRQHLSQATREYWKKKKGGN